MFEQNIKSTIIPLIDKDWDKTNKDILSKLKFILSDSIYFKCFNKLSSTYSESILNSIITSLEYKKYSKNILSLHPVIVKTIRHLINALRCDIV